MQRRERIDMMTRTIADKAMTVRIDSSTVEADPNTKWLNQDEVFGSIRERFGYEV